MMPKDGNQKKLGPWKSFTIHFRRMKILMERDSVRLTIHKLEFDKAQNVKIYYSFQNPLPPRWERVFCIENVVIGLCYNEWYNHKINIVPQKKD